MLLNFLRNFSFLLSFIILTAQAMEEVIHPEATLTPSGIVFRKLLLGEVLPSSLENIQTFERFAHGEISSFFQKIPPLFKYFPEGIQEGLIRLADEENEEAFVCIGDKRRDYIDTGIQYLARNKLQLINPFDSSILQWVSFAQNNSLREYAHKKPKISREEIISIAHLSQWDIFQVALNDFNLGEQCKVLAELQPILLNTSEIKIFNKIQQAVFSSISLLQQELEEEKNKNKTYKDQLTLTLWQDIQSAFSKNSSLYNLIKTALEAENKEKDYTPDKFCDAIQAHEILRKIWHKDPNKQKNSFKVILTQEAQDKPLWAYKTLELWFDQKNKVCLEEFIKTWKN